MFIHRINTGVSGSTLPASSAITISNPWARLVGMTKRMVFFRLSYTRRPSRTALAMVAKLSSVSTISAASLVTSVPLIPIATPTSACFNAGASFTPSPVIPTISFLLCRACTRRNLSSGLVRAKISNCCAATLSCASSITSSSRPVMAFPALQSPALLPMPHRRLRVVAGDHLHADPGLQAVGNRRDGLRTRRIHHPGDPSKSPLLQILMGQFGLACGSRLPGCGHHP